jgi:ATP-independent RNA helicase DbpA
LSNSFKTLTNLNEDLLSTLLKFEFTQMTEIQEKSLPYTLDGKDIIGKAKTGSGKTIAFSIPILNKLNTATFDIQTMILAPTRELANQISEELKQLAKFKHNIKILTLCGGVPYNPQMHSLSHKAHIIVGTPGRILKHLENKNFNPNLITTLVLDEADRMLDMGFSEDINKIIAYLPKQRQTMLFSATYPSNIEKLSRDIMINPITVEVESVHSEDKISQVFYETDGRAKVENILKILDHYQPSSTIIFCNMKIDCDNLADELERYDIYSLVLHSDLEQKDRDETMTLFANKSYKILIATDVASRGLDIDDVELVVNYSLPKDLEVYTHRIGRTARAGKSGHAVSLIDSGDVGLFEDLTYESHHNLEEIPSKIDTKYDDNPLFKSIFINGGKKQKLSRGDILGALTAGIGLDKNQIGKIDIKDLCAYVALDPKIAKKASNDLGNSKIKGKFFRVYLK